MPRPAAAPIADHRTTHPAPGLPGPARILPGLPRPSSGLALLLPGLALLLGLALFPAGVAAQDYDPEARLAEMGITLPVPESLRTPSFDRVVQTGNLVFTSGHAACGEWDGTGRGKVPSEVSPEDAQVTARQVGICILGSLKAHLGDLSRVTRIVKVLGMVNSEPDFTGQSQVMNGFSNLMQEVFGDRGHHARSAVGMAALPVNLTVEIEVVVEVDGG